MYCTFTKSLVGTCSECRKQFCRGCTEQVTALKIVGDERLRLCLDCVCGKKEDMSDVVDVSNFFDETKKYTFLDLDQATLSRILELAGPTLDHGSVCKQFRTAILSIRAVSSFHVEDQKDMDFKVPWNLSHQAFESGGIAKQMFEVGTSWMRYLKMQKILYRERETQFMCERVKLGVELSDVRSQNRVLDKLRMDQHTTLLQYERENMELKQQEVQYKKAQQLGYALKDFVNVTSGPVMMLGGRRY